MTKTDSLEQPVKTVRPQGGAQSVRRTLSILRSISTYNDDGARLSKIARHVDLPPPTVHRILSVLIEEDFVSFDPVSKLYHMGAELYAMGEDSRLCSIRDRYQTAVRRITEQTGDATYLVIRSGYDGVCIDRVLGSARVQVLGYNIGERHPLGMGAAGQALLAFLPEHECAAILEANSPRYLKYYNIHVDEVRTWIQQGQDRKHTYSSCKITQDAVGVGAPIFNKAGCVVAAISTAGICARMTPDRCRKNSEIIIAEIAAIEPPD
ncbi:putative transcriptional regulator (IclR-family protein) [Desulforapulum autotrophicum HRM2]|uniref:Transcriptional regulator (IclR-family protein) n=1 Tax=Desulforapulum autotrophicum (strain ATCC 43914 / DSM 3382 / VKM B-1955 / HRM2) TaxID=177437 RepID=C0Q8R7_DESAH|nr:putative transcriptional regulator (IclR-family protein) [Desulforapulum autotrophicum HRM2]